ncbi:MAG: sensor histidine kinase [Nocardioidaceae bacterium]
MPRTTADVWLRDRPTPRERRNDVLLGVALAVFSALAIELLHSATPSAPLGWNAVEAYLWAAALGLVLCVRRAFPLGVLVLSSLLFFALGHRVPAFGISLPVQICLFLAMYTAWAWSRKRLALRWTSALVVVGMFVWVVVQFAREDYGAGMPTVGLFDPLVALATYQIGVNVVYFFGAIAFGIVSWRGAHQREELRDQTEELRREQETNARRAVADERIRIARDLHDVVAHHVSSIGVHAAGARRMIDREPASTADALRTIENSSRTAVSEMHQLVGLLRTAADGTNGDRSPHPGLDELPELVDASGGQRVRTELREVGERFEVSETVGLSIYRTAQEALSNVRAHSTASTVAVVLRFLVPDEGGRAVEIEIIDNGSPVSRSAGSDGREGGWGLKGIQERATLHGGETEIGPRPAGGFRVRMRLPVAGDA